MGVGGGNGGYGAVLVFENRVLPRKTNCVSKGPSAQNVGGLFGEQGAHMI